MFYLEFFARILLLLGGLNYLTLVTYNISLFSYVKNPTLIQIIIGLIGVSALYLGFNRDYYLPFLGKCVLPLGKGEIDKKQSTKIILENLPPNVNVIYWGSKSGVSSLTNPREAYGDYLNSGIGKTNNSGVIQIELECPSPYTVSKFGIGKTLDKHVHYRYQLPDMPGMLSRVFTKKLDENCK